MAAAVSAGRGRWRHVRETSMKTLHENQCQIFFKCFITMPDCNCTIFCYQKLMLEHFLFAFVKLIWYTCRTWHMHRPTRAAAFLSDKHFEMNDRGVILNAPSLQFTIIEHQLTIIHLMACSPLHFLMKTYSVM